MRKNKIARVVSFSGIDGAGKSTQIEALRQLLRAAGVRFMILTFWDDVVVLPRLREFLAHEIFRGDKGVGSVERPICRRDKNVRSWYATAARLFFHFFDALNLRRKVASAQHDKVDFIIFDRYIYDQLANLPLDSRVARFYVRLILMLSPAPDVAYLIDADPAAARARKPEYPLAFLHRNRDAYLALREFAGDYMIVVDSSSIETMTTKIMESFPLPSSRSEEETPNFPRYSTDLPHSEI
jgi:thymidylate kinase